jgi:hypothetical protein
VALDRSIRSLIALKGAATSRVLNLCTIERANVGNAEYQSAPLFASPVLNTAIFIKHRLRPDEVELFFDSRPIATKIVIPFDKSDLRAGGRSFFIQQASFLEGLKETCNFRSEADLRRDLQVLDVIDKLPSLDPFLLREKLRGNGFNVDNSYFALSLADQQRMFDYSSIEVGKLVSMAAAGAGAPGTATSTMISALLSSQPDERLDPLRAALNLSDNDFREGVFSWRGFLYYKWSLGNFLQQTRPFFTSMAGCQPSGPMSADDKQYLVSSKRAIIQMMEKYLQSVEETIGIYDRAYASMIERREPKAFRDFLLGAPALFLEMGEKMGTISHIISFWEYRFPVQKKGRMMIDAEDLKIILQDFAIGLGVQVQMAA